MNATIEIVPSILDRIRKTLVGLKMPRAQQVLDQATRQLERGEAGALEVIDTLFAEELTQRENRPHQDRSADGQALDHQTARKSRLLVPADRLVAIAFSRWPSSIFLTANKVGHFLGLPGTGKSHLATALGVETVKAGRRVYFAGFADFIDALAKFERK